MTGTSSLFVRFTLAAAVCLLSMGCDRPPKPAALEVIFSTGDVQILADQLNANIRDGSLTSFTDEDNVYEIRLAGFAPIPWTLNIEEQIIGIPFGFAVVRLNNLRIRDVQCRWNAAERALQATFRIEDNPTGILADVTILNQKTKREFVVESGRINCFLEPVLAADGSLDFAPLRVELTANTDDVAPELREIVRDQLHAFGDRIASELQRLMNTRKSELVAFLSSQLTPGAVLNTIVVTDTDATFRASLPLPEDLTGDRAVDIADLVLVALDFGAVGVPGFAPSDVNRDGVVDIVDIVLVAQKFGAQAFNRRRR